ncbi:efflux RND transporter permease subunit [Amaricoccus macauensis]|uniref:efflux RND transporter permease subunit n=1 Tax=Amaricoccus macauensis TaxID=57001 RepID=UPI003C7BDA76
MISSTFIDRPKFALVISIVISLIGGIAYIVLPVEQFPQITPPVVRVSASFTGASAETLEETVAAPIEAQVNGVDDMLYMSSTSADSGSYSLDVTFAVGTDPDLATVNTQNRVSQAVNQLPAEVNQNGVSTQKSSTNMLMLVTVFSEDEGYDEVFLSNFASINLRDALSRVTGVGRVDVMTDFSYGMRIWLDPDRLASLGMTPTDFANAISDQNAIVPAGQIGAPPAAADQQFQYTVKAKGRLSDPAEFEQIVLRTGEDGAIVTVGDVARVELGSQVYSFAGRYDRESATVMAVYQAPGANALDVSEGVLAELDRLKARFPQGVDYEVPFNTTAFVESSLDDVIETLLIAFVLVISVVFIFLGNLRATIVPMVAIPVSLIGAFAIMFALGMSLNTVTLFALVLAIGIVVDDAIIVVENVEHHIAEGLSPRDATRLAMREITAPVIATTLVLLAVFVPVTIMPGITGRLYSQFAITISGAVIISSINALTLSPALCALILKPRQGPPKGLLAGFERTIGVARDGYAAIVAALARKAVFGLVAIALVVAGIGGLSGVVPSGFLPDEDQGFLMVDVQLPEGASLNRTEAVSREMEAMLEEVPGIAHLVTVDGFSMLNGGASSNAAFMAITLTPWSERTEPELSAQALLAKIQGMFNTIPSASIIAFNPPPIAGLGSAGGVEMKIQQTGGGSPQDLASAIGSMVYAANQRPEIALAYSTFRANVPQLFVDLDREKAKTLDVNVSEVFGTLQAYLGSYYVNDFNMFGRVYKVMMQADSGYRDTVDDIGKLYVRSNGGEMVPMSTLVTVDNILGPMSLNRFNMFRAASVTANPAPGYSTGSAIAALEEVASDALPPGYAFEWTGSAVQEQEAGGLVALILGLAVIFAYLFLVAQYESWTMPIAILLTVIVAIFGAYCAVWVAGKDANLYTQIGMIMLVGMGAKNAILVVEFAMETRAKGASIYDAALTAARLRFRAVLMTALSFLLGVFPLVIASGAGAASQSSIGVAVFGGMLAATTLGLILIPVLYVAIQAAREWSKRQYQGIYTPLDAPESEKGLVEPTAPA